MNRKQISRKYIGLRNVEKINESALVMRHFIELSAKMLPYFNELSKKEKLLPFESADRNKIMEVFKTYQFETFTSEIILGSKVLEQITSAYESISMRIPYEFTQADECLKDFQKTHKTLIQDWNKTDMN